MSQPIRVVHYLNQFFGQIGGEEQARLSPRMVPGAVGPGRRLQQLFGDRAEIVATAICGDNYIAERPDDAGAEVLALIEPFRPELIVAGPAFAAGRYGIACGEICRQAVRSLGIPAVAGMHPDQPAVELYRAEIVIGKTGDSASGMEQALQKLATLGLKLKDKQLGSPEEDGYVPRGIRRNVVKDRTAAERAVDMILAKVAGRPFESEVPLVPYEAGEPAPPVRDLRKAAIALVTTGGIVPPGNPDHLKAGVSFSYGKYSLIGVDDLTGDAWDIHHGGYYHGHVVVDPDRMMPVDVMRDLERDGRIGRLHDYFYSLSGQGTYPQAAKEMAGRMAEDLKASGVGAAIVTST